VLHSIHRWLPTSRLQSLVRPPTKPSGIRSVLADLHVSFPLMLLEERQEPEAETFWCRFSVGAAAGILPKFPPPSPKKAELIPMTLHAAFFLKCKRHPSRLFFGSLQSIGVVSFTTEIQKNPFTQYCARARSALITILQRRDGPRARPRTFRT